MQLVKACFCLKAQPGWVMHSWAVIWCTISLPPLSAENKHREPQNFFKILVLFLATFNIYKLYITVVLFTCLLMLALLWLRIYCRQSTGNKQVVFQVRHHSIFAVLNRYFELHKNIHVPNYKDPTLLKKPIVADLR